MELRQLRTFRQIAASGSISAASGVLRVAQPALSRQMQALEEELGTSLFHRTGRGVALTAAGRALLAEAGLLLDQAARVTQEIRAYGANLAGEATIGIPPTIGRLITLPLIEHVATNFPALHLRVAEAFSGTLLEWLQAGRLDAAILYHMPTTNAIHSAIVAHEPLSVIGSHAHATFPCSSTLPIAVLGSVPVVLPTSQHALRMMVDHHVAEAEVLLNLRHEIDSLDAIIKLVSMGSLFTILPESAVRVELSTGKLKAWRIGNPPLVRPLVIATGKQRAEAIGNRDIADLMRRTVHLVAQECNWHPA